jgi:eukaryotic-like serine/threonine-protein kinase
MPKGIEADAGVTEGQILAGKYRVEKVLGVGGMGVVVAARHLELDEKVAIKFLLPSMLADGAAVARFQREARATVRIKSEHVARVFDVGRLENGAPYMVMEFLEGRDLSGLLAQQGALPLPQAVDFILQTCVGVADAHALGIVHRDLKPANLFCVRRSDGQLSIKVLDFGISKLAESDGSGVSFTQTSAMMGSPLYMSPEQFRSTKNVDERTDIWAIGAIAFELVTGNPPFTAGSVTELAIKVATETAPAASRMNPAVPPEFAGVLATCLEREMDRRYRSVAELAVALAPFAPARARPLVDRVVAISGQPVSVSGEAARSLAASGAVAGVSVSSEPRVSSSSVSRTAGAVQWTSPGSSPRRSMLPTFAVVGALLALGGAGAAWWTTQRAGPREAVESATVLPEPTVVSGAPSTLPALPTSSPLVTPAGSTPMPATSAPSSPEQPHPLPAARPSPVRAVKPKPVPVGTAPAAARPADRKRPPTAAPGAGVNCDPPFFFDSKGNRVFKQECL